MVIKIKNIFTSILKGIREGQKLELIPKKLQDFNNLIFVKVFRFLGAVSTSVILSSKFNLLKAYNIYDLNIEIFYISMFFSLIYLFYKLIFNLFILKNLNV